MTIHLITVGKYSNKQNWPKIWHKCFNSLSTTQHNIRFWNDDDIENILIKHDKEFYINYLSKLNIIYKIDYVRYIILNEYGGAYFDMDIEYRMDFLPLLDKETTYILEGGLGELVTNAIMITYKKCTLWKYIINKAKFNIINHFELAKQDPSNTLKLVGPLFLSKWLADFWNRQRLNKISEPHVELLGHPQFGNAGNTLTFTRHHSTQTWGNNNSIMI